MAHAERPDEFGLIAEAFAPLAAGEPGAFGLKDDAALLKPSPGMELVLTVDALVEGVHFLPSDPAETVAAKLLRVNLSDLAAKGAVPRAYLLTTAWNGGVGIDWIRRFAAGLAEDQRRFGIALLGGDTVSTPGPTSFSLTALGEVPEGAMLRRQGARAGDGIFVTGTLGDGALGLAVATGELALDPAQAAFLLGRYRLPEPRMAVGPRLRGVATASMDISDGLMADLGHLCAASGVGARLETALLPLSEAGRRCLELQPELLQSVLTGGDDYEILFAAPQEALPRLKSIMSETGVPITQIGTFAWAGEGLAAFDRQDRPISLKRMGFRHF